MPFIMCQNIKHRDTLNKWAGTLFMQGVCPIEMIIQTALSVQAPTVSLYNHFCMAELYTKIMYSTMRLTRYHLDSYYTIGY